MHIILMCTLVSKTSDMSQILRSEVDLRIVKCKTKSYTIFLNSFIPIKSIFTRYELTILTVNEHVLLLNHLTLSLCFDFIKLIYD